MNAVIVSCGFTPELIQRFVQDVDLYCASVSPRLIIDFTSCKAMYILFIGMYAKNNKGNIVYSKGVNVPEEHVMDKKRYKCNSVP